MNVTEYKETAEGVLKDMSEATAACQHELKDVEERRQSAKVSLSEGIVGRNGYAGIMEELQAREDTARNTLNKALANAAEGVSEAQRQAFGITADQVPMDELSVLQAVDMNPEELAQAVAAWKPKSYVMVKACLAKAKRSGMSIEDDAPVFTAAVNEAVAEFARYCDSATRSNAYDSAWGQIVLNAQQAIGSAYSDYMGKPWIEAA